jgi:outer membrane receptor protein involved in Fe transport
MNIIKLLAATALGSGLLLVSTTAWAQDVSPQPAPDDDGQIANADGSEASSGEDIVVTGSRIRRAGFDTLEPAVVVSNEYLETRGLTNVADALNEIPGFGVGVTPEGGQSSFGVGQNFVNRFGLGSARTLTLVNGRRFVSTNAPTIFGNPPGLQVDLNIIPSRLVDRIENIAIGGAPSYGSDAIAGTVNVILKQDFDGIDLFGLAGITERGDAPRYSLSAIVGKNFAGGRGNITFAASYDRADGVLALERDVFQQGIGTGTNPTAGSASALIPGRTPGNDGRVNPNVPFNTGNADGIANLVYIRNTRIFSLTAGGLLYPTVGSNNLADGTPRGFGADGRTRLQFDSNGNLVPFNPGLPFGAQNASGGDGFDLASTSQLTSQLERYTANFLGKYEITPNITAFAEGTYYRANGTELVDQSIYNATLFGGASSTLTFAANDPRLTQQARDTLAGLGVTQFRLSRASRDLVENNASARSEVYRGVIGLRGDFELAGRNLFWEATANYGRTEGQFFQTVLNQQNFVNAINNCNPTPAFNSAPGGIAPVADAACIPLDIFGENRTTSAARAYVTDQTKAQTALEQQVYNVNLSGDLFSLWSGNVGFAVGFEHRYEYGSFTPDAFQQAGLGRAVPIGPNEGSFSTNEVFGELLIPLVSPENDVPLIYNLQLEGKVRYVDNTVNGGFTAYTAGGRYSPIRDIQFRGNYTRSLRAPSITELFTPQSPSFNLFPDPCDAALIGSGTNPAIRARNCAAFFEEYGINGATFNSNARVATIPSLSGGDVNLDNEEGRAYTFGVVIQPSFIPRLRLAVDWNRIRITGNIASLTPGNIAEGCYDNPDFDASNPDAGNAFCTLFTRVRSADPATNGQLVNDAGNPGLRTVFVNGAFIEMKGLTGELAYNFVLGATRIDVGSTLFYLDTLRSSNNAVTITDFEGALTDPEFSGQFNLGLTTGNVGVDLQANYRDSAVFARSDTVESRDILSVSDYWTFNGSLNFRIEENSNFRLTVTNMFDRDAPFPVTTNGAGIYDFLGRRFTASISKRF